MSEDKPAYPPGHGLLAGKTVVVTAAAGTGIGFAAARRCAEEGARLLISDLHERRLSEAAARIGEQVGQRPATALCDVTKPDQVRRLGEDKVFDISEAARDLDFAPRPFSEGLREKLAGRA